MKLNDLSPLSSLDRESESSCCRSTLSKQSAAAQFPSPVAVFSVCSRTVPTMTKECTEIYCRINKFVECRNDSLAISNSDRGSAGGAVHEFDCDLFRLHKTAFLSPSCQIQITNVCIIHAVAFTRCLAVLRCVCVFMSQRPLASAHIFHACLCVRLQKHKANV